MEPRHTMSAAPCLTYDPWFIALSFLERGEWVGVANTSPALDDLVVYHAIDDGMGPEQLLNLSQGVEKIVAAVRWTVSVPLHDIRSMLSQSHRFQYLNSLSCSGWALLLNQDLEMILQQCTRLADLDLTGCASLSDEALTIMSRSACTNLRCLTLAACTGLTEEGITHFLPHCAGIKALDLSSCPAVSDAVVTAMAENLRHLEDVRLEQCKRITNVALSAMARSAQDLVVLSLSGCERITDVGANEIFKVAPLLQEVNLSGCRKLTNGALVTLSRSCKDLAVLDVSQCVVTDLGLGALAKGCSKLIALFLRACNKVTPDGLKRLATSTTCDVLALDVSECTELTDAAILEFVAHSPNLTEFSMRACNRLTDASLSAVAHNCRSLVKIDVSRCNKVTNEGMGEVIRACTELRHINLELCERISDATVREIAFCCPHLRSLNVSYCPDITEESLDELVERCKFVKRIKVFGCYGVTQRFQQTVAAKGIAFTEAEAAPALESPPSPQADDSALSP